MAQLLARLLHEALSDRADLGWTDALFPEAGFAPLIPFGRTEPRGLERRREGAIELFRTRDERWEVHLAGRRNHGRTVDALAYWVGGMFAAMLDDYRPERAAVDEGFRYLVYVLATCRWSGYQGLEESVRAVARPAGIREDAQDRVDRVWDALGRPLPRLGTAVKDLAAWLVAHGDLEDGARLYAEAYEISVFAENAELGMDAAAGVAFAYRRAARWEDAESWYSLAAELAAFEEDWSRLSWITSGYATLYADRGAHPRAREMYTEALALGVVAQDGPAQGRAHLSLSVTEYYADDWDAALGHAWKALTLHADPDRRAEGAMMIGSILAETAEQRSARVAYRVALSLATEVDTIAGILGGMSLSYARDGNQNEFEAISEQLWAIDGMSARCRSQCLEGRALALHALGDERFHGAAAESIAYAIEHGYAREVVEVEQLVERSHGARADLNDRVRFSEIDAGLRELACQLPPSGV